MPCLVFGTDFCSPTEAALLTAEPIECADLASRLQRKTSVVSIVSLEVGSRQHSRGTTQMQAPVVQ